MRCSSRSADLTLYHEWTTLERGMAGAMRKKKTCLSAERPIRLRQRLDVDGHL
jgi:hypothetical protein